MSQASSAAADAATKTADAETPTPPVGDLAYGEPSVVDAIRGSADLPDGGPAADAVADDS